MMPADDITEKAQRQLEQARQRAGIEASARRRPRKVDTFGELFNDVAKRRLPVLRDQVLEEVRAHFEAAGIDPGLLEMAVDMRARQLLREEIDPDWQARREAEEESAASRAIESRLKSWRFPANAIVAILTGKDPDDRKPPADRGDLFETDSEAWLRAAWAKGGRIVALVGVLGTGKTIAACRVVNDSLQDEPTKDVIFCTAREVFTQTERRESDRPWLRRVERCEVLIVDECGTDVEREESDSKQLASILHARYEARRRTIILANMDKHEFSRRYTDAVMSRIFQSGGLHNCTQVVRRGELRRQQLELV